MTLLPNCDCCKKEKGCWKCYERYLPPTVEPCCQPGVCDCPDLGNGSEQLAFPKSITVEFVTNSVEYNQPWVPEGPIQSYRDWIDGLKITLSPSGNDNANWKGQPRYVFGGEFGEGFVGGDPEAVPSPVGAEKSGLALHIPTCGRAIDPTVGVNPAGANPVVHFDTVGNYQLGLQQICSNPIGGDVNAGEYTGVQHRLWWNPNSVNNYLRTPEAWDRPSHLPPSMNHTQSFCEHGFREQVFELPNAGYLGGHLFVASSLGFNGFNAGYWGVGMYSWDGKLVITIKYEIEDEGSEFIGRCCKLDGTHTFVTKNDCCCAGGLWSGNTLIPCDIAHVDSTGKPFESKCFEEHPGFHLGWRQKPDVSNFGKCHDTEEECKGDCNCHRCWGRWPSFPGECESEQPSVRCKFDGREIEYPSQISVKVTANNFQAGAKYDYEPDPDIGQIQAFVNSINVNYLRDPEHDYENSSGEILPAYTVHPSVDVTTCEQVRDNPWGVAHAFGVYSCDSSIGQTVNSYGAGPNVIWLNCEDKFTAEEAGVRFTTSGGIGFQSCFNPLYSSIAYFDLVGPSGSMGPISDTNRNFNFYRIGRDFDGDRVDVSFNFSNSNAYGSFTQSYCYGTGGTGASGGSPRANWHGSHGFTANWNMEISFQLGFKDGPESESGTCCMPDRSLSTTRKECEALCGIYFPPGEPVDCPDVVSPVEKRCSDEKPGSDWYPIHTECTTLNECIDSGCECWRCYENASGTKKCSNTPISGWSPTTGCHKTKDECQQNCGDCWSKYERSIGWICPGPPTLSCLQDALGNPLDIYYPETITMRLEVSNFTDRANNEVIGENNIGLASFFSGLTLTLRKSPHNTTYHVNLNHPYDQHTHDVMTGNQVHPNPFGNPPIYGGHRAGYTNLLGEPPCTTPTYEVGRSIWMKNQGSISLYCTSGYDPVNGAVRVLKGDIAQCCRDFSHFSLGFSKHPGFPPSTPMFGFGTSSSLSAEVPIEPDKLSYELFIPYEKRGTGNYGGDFGNMSFQVTEPNPNPGFAEACQKGFVYHAEGGIRFWIQLSAKTTLGRCCERDGTCSQTTHMECYEKCGMWTAETPCEGCIEVPETETKCFKTDPGGDWVKISGCHSTESGCNGPAPCTFTNSQGEIEEVQMPSTMTSTYNFSIEFGDDIDEGMQSAFSDMIGRLNEKASGTGNLEYSEPGIASGGIPGFSSEYRGEDEPNDYFQQYWSAAFSDANCSRIQTSLSGGNPVSELSIPNPQHGVVYGARESYQVVQVGIRSAVAQGGYAQSSRRILPDIDFAEHVDDVQQFFLDGGTITETWENGADTGDKMLVYNYLNEYGNTLQGSPDAVLTVTRTLTIPPASSGSSSSSDSSGSGGSNPYP